MMLVVEKIPTGLDMIMVMIGMRESLGTFTMYPISGQQGALIAIGNPREPRKKFLDGTSDQLIEMLGGSPGTAEYSVSSEAKRELGLPKIYGMC